MNDQGILSVAKNSGDIVYQLEGKNTVCNEGDVKCIPGLSIDEWGKVKINGSKGKVTVKAAVKLQPWPFVEGVTVPDHFNLQMR